MEWATDPVVLLSIVAGAALLLVLQWQTARPAAGFGSGSNTWFRHIDSTPRKHQPKHHKLEHVWEYTGRGVRPNASGDGFVDDMTGEEVVGPLAGRQTWRPHARDDEDTLRAFEPEDKAFNPVKNPVSTGAASQACAQLAAYSPHAQHWPRARAPPLSRLRGPLPFLSVVGAREGAGAVLCAQSLEWRARIPAPVAAGGILALR